MERLVPDKLTNAASAAYLKNLTATVNYITSNGGYAVLDPYVISDVFLSSMLYSRESSNLSPL